MNLDRPISDLMNPPVTVDVADSLTDVRTAMLNRGFHHMPVLQDGKLVGLLSALDLMRATHDLDADVLATGVVLSDQTIGSLMQQDLVCMAPSAPLRAAVAVLAEGRFHSLPVVEDGLLVGIVTTTDLMRQLLRQ